MLRCSDALGAQGHRIIWISQRDCIRLSGRPQASIFFFCPVFEAYLLIMGARNFLSSVLKIDGIRKLKLPVAISHPLECLYYFVCSQKHGS